MCGSVSKSCSTPCVGIRAPLTRPSRFISFPLLTDQVVLRVVFPPEPNAPEGSPSFRNGVTTGLPRGLLSLANSRLDTCMPTPHIRKAAQSEFLIHFPRIFGIEPSALLLGLPFLATETVGYFLSFPPPIYHFSPLLFCSACNHVHSVKGWMARPAHVAGDSLSMVKILAAHTGLGCSVCNKCFPLTRPPRVFVINYIHHGLSGPHFPDKARLKLKLWLLTMLCKSTKFIP